MKPGYLLSLLAVVGVLIASPRANAQYSASWTDKGVTYSALLNLNDNALSVTNLSNLSNILVTGIYCNGDLTSADWTLTGHEGNVVGYTGNGSETAAAPYNWFLSNESGISQNSTLSIAFAGTVKPQGVYPFAFQFTDGNESKVVVLDAPVPEPALYQIAAFMVLGSMSVIRYRRRK